MVHIAARPRSPALAQFITSFHYHESENPPVIERILPSGNAHLMVNLAENEFRTYSGADCRTIRGTNGAVLAGPHGRFTAIDTSEQHWLLAVEFKVAGAAGFFRLPMSEMCDQIVPLEDLWRRDGEFVRERLCETPTPELKFDVLETLLLEHFVRPCGPVIPFAIRLLDDGISVAEASSRVGLLPKSFVKRFRDEAGLAPKHLARVRRLQRVVGSVSHAGRVDWCRVAAEHGYTDQAHLIHDFRDLAGITPTAYRPSSPQRSNHVPVVPAG